MGSLPPESELSTPTASPPGKSGRKGILRLGKFGECENPYVQMPLRQPEKKVTFRMTPVPTVYNAPSSVYSQESGTCSVQSWEVFSVVGSMKGDCVENPVCISDLDDDEVEIKKMVKVKKERMSEGMRRQDNDRETGRKDDDDDSSSTKNIEWPKQEDWETKSDETVKRWGEAEGWENKYIGRDG